MNTDAINESLNKTMAAAADMIGASPQPRPEGGMVVNTAMGLPGERGTRRTSIVEPITDGPIGPIRYMDDPRIAPFANDPMRAAQALIRSGMALGTVQDVAEIVAEIGASAVLDAWWWVNDPRGIFRTKTSTEAAAERRNAERAAYRAEHPNHPDHAYRGGCPSCWHNYCLEMGW